MSVQSGHGSHIHLVTVVLLRQRLSISFGLNTRSMFAVKGRMSYGNGPSMLGLEVRLIFVQETLKLLLFSLEDGILGYSSDAFCTAVSRATRSSF